MNYKRRNWIIGAAVLIAIFGVVYWVFRTSLICCALPPTSSPPLRSMGDERENPTVAALFQQTQTAEYTNVFWLTKTVIYPYDPTLYAQRKHEELLMMTGAGPTQYAIFDATETALVAIYQGTLLPPPTPIPYTADMSPTAPLLNRVGTATPTLCPSSDVICLGGNATLSPVQEIYVLMASAKAPEFAQLAQTVTAMAITPLPSPTVSPTSSVHNSNCVFNWAHQDLPEIARSVQAVLDQIGSAKLTILRADAYGENCYTADGKVSYFAAMTTDFYLTVPVTDLTDTNTLGRLVTTAYNILTTLNIDLPAQPGYLDITFTAANETKHFRTMFNTLRPLVEAGKTGADLLATGGLK